MSGENEIERMVLKPTWKEVLLDMIATEKLDPWNIDIIVLANSFLGRVREMKTLDLHVPANIILAAAILLKYKSNALKIVEEPQLQETYPEEPSAEEIPKLELVSRIPPKGPVTLKDLLTEMERVIKYDDNREKPKPRSVEEVITIEAPRFDIEERMEAVFGKLRQRADSEGWATFSALLDRKTADETIYTLIPLLHLSQKKMVDLKQDEFFGEIFVRLNYAGCAAGGAGAAPSFPLPLWNNFPVA